MIQDIPSDEERQMLLQQLNMKDAQGQVDPEDIVTVYNIHNIKEARQYLAYKVKKRKKEAEEAAMQQIEANKQSQIESAQAAEQAKQQTMMMAHELKMKEITLTKEWDYKIALAKIESQELIAEANNDTAVTKQMMGDDTKAELATIPEAGQAPEMEEEMGGEEELDLESAMAMEGMTDEMMR
jgi:hypothetical protein